MVTTRDFAGCMGKEVSLTLNASQHGCQAKTPRWPAKVRVSFRISILNPGRWRVAIELPRGFVEHILLGSEWDRRFTQDSPILPDVWFEFGERPDRPLDLLLTPYEQVPASRVAWRLARRLDRFLKRSGRRR
jgi:hypothetical protein